MNFITLRRSYLIEVADSRNRQHTLSKKVSDEDSGWWKVSGKKVAPENTKITKNIKNINVKNENKNSEWYLLDNYPNMCYNCYTNSILTSS